MRWRDSLFSAVYALYILILFVSAGYLLLLAYFPSFRCQVALLFSTSAVYATAGGVLLLVALLLSFGLAYIDKQEILKINLQSEITPDVISAIVMHELTALFSFQTWSVETVIRNEQLIEIVIHGSRKQAHLLYTHQNRITTRLIPMLSKVTGYSGEVTLTVMKR
ncbi:MAG: hypothetical protein QRY72_00600 [Candidatus Rhabdochlamydia sp.]